MAWARMAVRPVVPASGKVYSRPPWFGALTAARNSSVRMVPLTVMFTPGLAEGMPLRFDAWVESKFVLKIASSRIVGLTARLRPAWPMTTSIGASAVAASIGARMLWNDR